MPEEKTTKVKPKEEERAIPPAVVSAHVPLFSPAGYVIAMIVLVIEGILVYTITSYFKAPTLPSVTPVQMGSVSKGFSLGSITVNFFRTLPSGGEEPTRLTIEPYLYFHATLSEPEKVLRVAEAKKPMMRDIVRGLFLMKGLSVLKTSSGLDDVKSEIKIRLNSIFGGDVIESVVYNDVEWI
jgi:flagellar basal body-associated protein FliL